MIEHDTLMETEPTTIPSVDITFTPLTKFKSTSIKHIYEPIDTSGKLTLAPINPQVPVQFIPRVNINDVLNLQLWLQT